MGKTTLWRAAVEHAEDARACSCSRHSRSRARRRSRSRASATCSTPCWTTRSSRFPRYSGERLSRALVLGDDEGAPLDPRALRRRPHECAARARRAADLSSSPSTTRSGSTTHPRPVSPTACDGFAPSASDYCSSRRSGLESALLDELLRSPAGERFTRVDVGALDVACARPSRPRAARRVASSAAARRGPRAVRRQPVLRARDRAHAPADGRLHRGRPARSRCPTRCTTSSTVVCSRCRSESRDFLLAAAAHAHPDDRDHRGGRPESSAPSASRRRSRRTSSSSTGDRIRFTHPLLAAGAYEIRRRPSPSRDPRAARRTSRRSRSSRVAAGGGDRRARTKASLRSSRTPRSAPAREVRCDPARFCSNVPAELTPARTPSQTSRDEESRRLTLITPRATPSVPRLAPRAGAREDPDGARASRRSSLRSPASARTTTTCEARVELYRQAIVEAPTGSQIEAYAQEGLGGTLLPSARAVGRGSTRLGSRCRDRKRGSASRSSRPRRLATKAVAEAALGRLEAAETAAGRRFALQRSCADRPVLRQPVFAASVRSFLARRAHKRARRVPGDGHRRRESSATRARCPTST